MRALESKVRATAMSAIAVTLMFVPATATAAALIPKPGTGHGVIGDTTPAEEGASLEFSPGVGGAAMVPCLASPLLEARRTGEQVGGLLPIIVCIGQFPTPSVQVTITPPRGPIIKFEERSGASGSGVGFTVHVTPSPPATRYRVADDRGVAAEGKLRGDGGGTYTVNARGGDASASTTFVLQPAPLPRLLSLSGANPAVAPGGRLRFGVAGKKPLSKFEVGVYGPASLDESGRPTYPVRTLLAARADKKGEAIIALDTLSSCPTGLFVAVVDPQTSPETPLPDPRAAIFSVK